VKQHVPACDKYKEDTVSWYRRIFVYKILLISIRFQVKTLVRQFDNSFTDNENAFKKNARVVL
jgi:hypothetical protein